MPRRAFDEWRDRALGHRRLERQFPRTFGGSLVTLGTDENYHTLLVSFAAEALHLFHTFNAALTPWAAALVVRMVSPMLIARTVQFSCLLSAKALSAGTAAFRQEAAAMATNRPDNSVATESHAPVVLDAFVSPAVLLDCAPHSSTRSICARLELSGSKHGQVSKRSLKLIS